MTMIEGQAKRKLRGKRTREARQTQTKRGTKDCQKQKLAVGSVPVRLKVRYSTTVAALLHR